MAKKDKVKIDKINIQIGEQEIPLTLDQAKELQQLLNDTFGLDKVYRPGYPIYTERPVCPRGLPYSPYPYRVTYTDTENALTFSLSVTNQAGSAANA